MASNMRILLNGEVHIANCTHLLAISNGTYDVMVALYYIRGDPYIAHYFYTKFPLKTPRYTLSERPQI